MRTVLCRPFSFFITLAAVASLAACSHGRGSGTDPNNPDNPDNMMMPAIGQITQVVIAPGTPSDAPTHFGGPADPDAAPQVVYPADGVIMPPNLSDLELQWMPGAGTNLFELRFVSTYLDLTIYTLCNSVGTGCGFEPDEATWMLMSTQSRGDTMTLTMRGTGEAAGNAVGTAAARTISFTDEDLLGGLYYWAAQNGQIVRYDFGKRGQTAENFYSAGDAGATCVGCHSLSRNGERIAVGLNAPIPTAGLRVLDVATKGKMFDRGSLFGGGSNFEAFSPDGSRILVNAGADLMLLDSNTGNMLGAGPAITGGNLPDWSADGARVVFAKPGPAGCPVPGLCDQIPGVIGADIYAVDVSGDHFGTPKMIASGGGNNFYPTYSPDGSVVAFNRSTANSSSFDAGDARVWIVDANGGTPIALANASMTGAPYGDSWPKFAPFVQHFKGETIFWLTFSSRRDYGLRLINSDKMPTTSPDGSKDDPRTAQVWMVGVPASALTGGGPAGGYPAFWLPFQSMASGNHIAQWTESVARQPCDQTDADPCPNGEICDNGECVGVPVL
jgi:hypothetical protein